MVGAGVGSFVAGFLPWYGFSTPAIEGVGPGASFSASVFTAHGLVPLSPLAAVPAVVGLVMALERAVPLLRTTTAAGTNPSTATTDTPARGEPSPPGGGGGCGGGGGGWWPDEPVEPEPSSEDTEPSPSPAWLPPRSWRDPILEGWALLVVVLYFFVDTSQNGRKVGYWLTLVLAILIPILT